MNKNFNAHDLKKSTESQEKLRPLDLDLDDLCLSTKSLNFSSDAQTVLRPSRAYRASSQKSSPSRYSQCTSYESDEEISYNSRKEESTMSSPSKASIEEFLSRDLLDSSVHAFSPKRSISPELSSPDRKKLSHSSGKRDPHSLYFETSVKAKPVKK